MKKSLNTKNRALGERPKWFLAPGGRTSGDRCSLTVAVVATREVEAAGEGENDFRVRMRDIFCFYIKSEKLSFSPYTYYK